jgi:hypothetical protein
VAHEAHVPTLGRGHGHERRLREVESRNRMTHLIGERRLRTLCPEPHRSTLHR